ncbi:hypothetical protein P2318_26515 [Myxococcaceae bacterium GXIMD 01537]
MPDSLSPLAHWQCFVEGARGEVAILTLSSLNFIVETRDEVFEDSAREQSSLLLDIATPGTHHESFEFQVVEVGYAATAVPVYELTPAFSQRPGWRQLFLKNVAAPALHAAGQRSGPSTQGWQWCFAGHVGTVSDFRPDGTCVALDSSGAIRGFSRTYDSSAGIDILLDGTHVTWVPAFLIPLSGSEGVRISARTDEVGMPINFTELTRQIVAHPDGKNGLPGSLLASMANDA